MRAFDFSPLFRSTIGFDRLFDLIDSYAEQSQSYPPYNIERSLRRAGSTKSMATLSRCSRPALRRPPYTRPSS